jgi:hypothetical protein
MEFTLLSSYKNDNLEKEEVPLFCQLQKL